MNLNEHNTQNNIQHTQHAHRTQTKSSGYKSRIKPTTKHQANDYNKNGNLKHAPEQWRPWLGFDGRTPLPKTLFNIIPIKTSSTRMQRFRIPHGHGETGGLWPDQHDDNNTTSTSPPPKKPKALE